MSRNNSEGNLNRLFQLQLDEKERLIREQQAAIQDLRVQLNAEGRIFSSRAEELNEKLRNAERERNDLRTRLANDMRNAQMSKDDLLEKHRGL